MLRCPCTRLPVLSPLVLTANLLLLLRREVVLNIERLANLLRALPLDHVRDRLAPNIQQRLDVEVVRREDDLKQHLLVDLHELLIPLLDVGGLAAGRRGHGVGVVGVGVLEGVVAVVLAPFQHLLQDDLVHVGDGDVLFGGAFGAEVFEHVFDEGGALGDLAVDGDFGVVVGDEGDGCGTRGWCVERHGCDECDCF